MNVLIIPLYKQKYWPKFTKFVCGKDGKQNLVFSSAPSTPSYCMPVLTCKMRCPSLFAGLLWRCHAMHVKHCCDVDFSKWPVMQWLLWLLVPCFFTSSHGCWRQAASELGLTGAGEGRRQLKGWESLGPERNRYLSVCHHIIMEHQLCMLRIWEGDGGPRKHKPHGNLSMVEEAKQIHETM